MGNKKQTNATIVSHTHWDREWYLPFQVFRKRLVELIDNLSNILGRNPEFKNFLLDGQTVVLEDYLDIKPQSEEKLKKLISQGRISVGPWYTQLDEFLIDGESIVRNLMLGHKIARKFGGGMKVGYIPDSFGHISQMPQILRGFGIDKSAFSRGLDDEGKELPTEFYWKAPDGSTVLSVHLRFTYCNAADLPENLDDFKKRITDLVEIQSKWASTSNVLLMNGCDHKEPQSFLPDLVEKLNREIGDICLTQDSLPEFLRKVQEEMPRLSTITGEQRSSKYVHLLPGVISTRMYLKQENAEAENLIEHWAEPFSAFAWLLGAEYPGDMLWKAWKYLLQNHAHDSICGCSIDQVHTEMLTRFAWSKQIGQEITSDSIRFIADKIDTRDDDALTFLVVFNPTGWPHTGVAHVRIKLPKKVEHICIKDSAGKIAPHQVLKGGKDVLDLKFIAENVPSYGYKTYGVYKADKEANITTSLKVNKTYLENEYLKVEIDSDGSLTVTDKRIGKTFQGLNSFEDRGDAGDEFNYSPPTKDEAVTSTGAEVSFELVEGGPVASAIKVTTRLALPRGLSKDRRRRTGKVKCPITSFVKLYPKVPRIDIETSFDNKAKDHRLRAVFPTSINTEYSFADSHFDVVRRKVGVPPLETYPLITFDFLRKLGFALPPAPVGKPKGWVEDPAPTHPQQAFVDVNDRKNGITIINKGLPEYEALANDEGVTIALTLLRCVGWLSRDDLSTRLGAGPIVPTPDAQCLGKRKFEYSIAPHAGTWKSSRMYKLATQFNAPLKVLQVDKHPGELPRSLSFISIKPTNLASTAIKKAEDEDSLIVRFYEINGKKTTGRIKLWKTVESAKKVNLNEEFLNPLEITQDNSIIVEVEPSKIVSVAIGF